MDSPPAIEVTAPAREVVRNSRGTILGVYERQGMTGRIVTRARGVVLGSFDPRSSETRDARGCVIGRGNFLGTLLVQAGR